MKIVHILSIVSVLAVLAFGAANVNAATTGLPFGDGFESGFDGSGGGATPWQTNSSGDHIAAASASAALAGSNGLILSNCTATLDITDSAYDNVWLRVYANPAPGTDDPSVSSISGAFYLKSDGTLRAYTGSWVQVESGLPTGQYLGFVVHADYSADEWCIYSSSGAYETNMTLAVDHDASGSLEFAAVGTHIQTFSFESGDTALFDGVAASPGFLSIGSCPGFVSTKEVSGAAVQSFELPLYPAALTNSGNDFISARAGNTLLTGVGSGDKVIFLTHANASDSSDNYLNTAGVFGVDPATPGAPLVGAKELLMSSRLQLDFASADPRVFFIPYDTALSEDGEATGEASGYVETITINGTDVNSGFTAVEWIESEDGANSLGFGAANPASGLDRGDLLYVQIGATTGWKTYWWDETQADNAKWRDGGSVAGTVVPAGARCWVQRIGSTGGRTFTITH
jgi:hypothetical protein